jgi:hypothetical protein
MAFPYIVQGKNIVVVIGNNTHTIASTHLCYSRIVDAIKADDWDTVQDLIEPKKVVLQYGAGNVAIEGERLFWKGTELHNSLATRIVRMFQEGFPIQPMIHFMENLMQNPSRRAVQELYGFLEKGELPITPDGHFLAYKKVRGDYKDIHSGTFDNSVGQICSMERNEVDDDKDRTCSAGLHFCSQSYLPHFGYGSDNRVMILKINPRDVVSIPSDYNDAKGRCASYEVVGELGAEERLEGTFNDDFDVTFEPEDDLDTIAITDSNGAPVQEYDRLGRPLSMTKDAIRKRLARREGRY